LLAAARAAGNSDDMNLLAGQTYALAPELPAGELVGTLAAETKTASEKGTFTTNPGLSTTTFD
jgi:nitronate monooxygenase